MLAGHRRRAVGIALAHVEADIVLTGHVGRAVAVIAALSYVPIAYVAYQAMGWLFGPSGGHPPVANAPEWVYWLVFVFAVPLICIAIAWLCVWNAQCWIGRR